MCESDEMGKVAKVFFSFCAVSTDSLPLVQVALIGVKQQDSNSAAGRVTAPDRPCVPAYFLGVFTVFLVTILTVVLGGLCCPSFSR